MKILFLFFVWLLNVSVNLAGEIYLDGNNILQNTVIYINEDVPEGNGSLLENIKRYMTESSRSLLTATQNMDPSKDGVQIGKVYIVLPKSWSATASEYITWQQCSKADFLISTNKMNGFKENPFTKQIGKCGQPGNFTRFPESFFVPTDNSTVTVQGKRIMKEFVKLRYGVFSEEPYRNQLTVYNGSRFIQSSCGHQIRWNLTGSVAKCSDQNNNCKYTIVKNQNHNYSIMFDHETPSSQYFCDDKNRPHNHLAASIHNFKCGGRSISSVILSHPDFAINKTKSIFSPPTFVLLKSQNRKIVFVLDLSSSMSGRVRNMQLAVVEFISNVVEDSAEIGLVRFSEIGQIYSNLLKMDTKSNRNTLVNIVNNLVPQGYTNIPDGMKKGVQVLGGNVDDGQKLYGTIFLLTDGENNREVNIWDDMSLIDKIIAKGLIINTIVYGKAVDNKLNNLAAGSGGRFVYADTSLSYSDLMSKFAFRPFCEIPINSSILVVEGKKEMVIESNQIETDLFQADAYMGKDLHLSMSFTISLSKYNITLIDSKKNVYTPISSTREHGVTTLTFKIRGNIQTGKYKLNVQTIIHKRFFKRAPQTFTITFMVSSTINQNTSRIINPTGHLSQNEIEEVNSLTNVMATVDLSTSGIQNDDRVLANLTIKDPNGIITIREMRDDGLGCDSIGGDAIFTSCVYPKDLTLLEFYSFSGNVRIYQNNSQDAIERTVNLGTLRVKRIAQTIKDQTPPAQIDSVNLTIADDKQRILKVDFFATGDDGLIGNISLYNIKIENKNETITSVKSQTGPHQPVSITIDSANDKSNDAFTVSVRGVDQAGNAGEWSPGKVFSWNYNIDRKKYGQFAGRNTLQSWSMGVCLMIGWLGLQ